MKKCLLALLALLVVSVMALPVQAEETIGFDLGMMFYKCSERTTKGMGGANSLTITFPPIDETTSIGFYQETLAFDLKDNKAAAAGTIVNIDVDIDAIQLTRTINPEYTFGMRLGMADVSAWDNTGNQLTLDDSVPVVDLFIKRIVLKGTKSQLTASLGYRVLFTQAFDPDAGGDFVKEIDDLSGFTLALSVGLRF